jgi:uncharacterized protein (DUF488 family)
LPIFTIGYGDNKFGDFILLLQQYSIAFVVDVRRFPKSKVPEYNRESLETKLPVPSPLKGGEASPEQSVGN